MSPVDIRDKKQKVLSLLQTGNLTEAKVLCEDICRLDPQNAGAWCLLGVLNGKLGQGAESERYLREAISLRPDYTEAHNNLGVALEAQKRYAEAEACYRDALRLMPEFADSQYNLGHVLKTQGQLDKAIECYSQTLKFEPAHANCHYSLSLIQLSRAHFASGWQHYGYRPSMREAKIPRLLDPPPQNVDGKHVLVVHDQGIGDEIFFLRFVHELGKRGATWAYQSSEKIFPLLARHPLIGQRLVPHGSSTTDLTLAVGDLPRLLGMERISQIPPSLLLTPISERLEQLRHRLYSLGSPPYLGITWRAGTPNQDLSLFKEIPQTRLASTLKDVNATVLILQRCPQKEEVGAFAQILGRPVHDLSALNDDLESMLALLSLIDDYVGVSNTNMHLRAAVGKTARVLVPSPPEWRWMAEGKESPWFPGFTVYRQGYDGSWGEAFAELTANLKTLN